MNELKWRLETKSNYYPTLVKRWEEWEFPIIPFVNLPDRIFVVYRHNDNDSGVDDIYAIPVYLTDSGICWIGFPTGNKNVDKQHKEGALEYILNVIGECMKYQGYTTIFTTSSNPKLCSSFEESGFMETDNNVKHYIKTL